VPDYGQPLSGKSGSCSPFGLPPASVRFSACGTCFRERFRNLVMFSRAFPQTGHVFASVSANWSCFRGRFCKPDMFSQDFCIVVVRILKLTQVFEKFL
jgi:hypothetical protein